MQGKWLGLKTLRYGLLLAVSVATLSGCVSAVSNDMRADVKPAQESDETVADAGMDETTTPVTAASTGNGTTADASTMADTRQTAAMTGQQGEVDSDRAGLVMQSTTLNAGRSSIYSNGTQAVATSNAYATQTGSGNAAVNSLYGGSGAQAADQSGRLPVEDMPPVDSSTQQQQPLENLGDEQAVVLPETVPIPKSARLALVDEAASGNAAELALSEETTDSATGSVPETSAQASLAGTQTKNQPRKTVTLASLFSGKRDAKAQFDGEGFSAQPRRVLNRDTAGSTQKASLGSLPGVTSGSSLFSNDHSEAEEVEDGAPQFKEVASLAGLARLAPNGLWLQTDKVKTGCFKPELLQVLKTIEKHYDKPIIVTSGLRDVKVRRAKQSLHTRCEAADIQIAGVTKWELADYLRSMPGRGGVGTYCHTESVHIDVGPERDWNWRCRRRK
ncbi:YcbK family protein [Shinella curvata]|uniref:YcbK family protein n=1 Tax=Shinella curvata TaxID=1817964 RepID=A0ABT8X8Y5_9HYPH|nr:YcbK family protein [Shinella curvata]MCJ8051916.1 YcbK family protein [Shinella curvata]MDO6120136.1 YcbK family protein [Shinella curvata]